MYFLIAYVVSLIALIGYQVYLWSRSQGFEPKLEKAIGARPRGSEEALAPSLNPFTKALHGRYRGREIAIEIVKADGITATVRAVWLGLHEPSSRFKWVPRDFGHKLYQRLQKAEPEDDFAREFQSFPARAQGRLTDPRLRDWLARRARGQSLQHLRIEDGALVAALRLGLPSFETVKDWLDGLCDLADFFDPEGAVGGPELAAAPVRARAREALRCPFCHDDFSEDDEVEDCPSCATRHHAECFAESGGCTVLGCRSSRARGQREAQRG